jgi:hypothetical protein
MLEALVSYKMCYMLYFLLKNVWEEFRHQRNTVCMYGLLLAFVWGIYIKRNSIV